MRKLLIIILFFMVASAAVGGIDLAFFNAKLMKLPPELIVGSFGSYLIPGLILLVVVGGTYLVAGVAVIKRSALAVEYCAIAGFGLMVWFFFELYLFPGHHFIQIVYFFIGIATLILTLAAERYGFAGEQISQKNANKEKALGFIREKRQTHNEEIRAHLGVSSRSVVRYLDELEKEGKIEQVGDVGRGVVYRVK